MFYILEDQTLSASDTFQFKKKIKSTKLVEIVIRPQREAQDKMASCRRLPHVTIDSEVQWRE